MSEHCEYDGEYCQKPATQTIHCLLDERAYRVCDWHAKNLTVHAPKIYQVKESDQ